MKGYLGHLNVLISENGEDELLTNQIKEFVYNELNFDTSGNSINDFVSETKTVTQKVRDSFPPMKRENKRKS